RERRNRDARQIRLSGEPDGVRAFFLARFIEQRQLALFAVEHFEHLVRAFGLKPVNVARVVRWFIKTFRSVTVKDRSAERRAFDRIAVATARDMPAREHELELAAARLAEKGDGRAAKPFLAAVMFDLLHDFLGVFRAVQTGENLADHP